MSALRSGKKKKKSDPLKDSGDTEMTQINDNEQLQRAPEERDARDGTESCLHIN